MRIRPGILIAIAAVFVVLIGGRFLGWFGGKETPPSPGEVTVANPVETGPDAGSRTEPIPIVGSGNTPRPIFKPVVPASVQPAVVPPAAAGLITNWEEKIDDVLTSQEDEAQKAKRLLAIFPNLPEDGQVEAAQHLSNLVADEDYKPLAQTLTNAAMPEAVLDVLMTDVLNRPNQIKLEALLDVARTPKHPKAEEARDVLEVFVDENFGQDWSAWEAAVKKWLQENPDE